jgi:hypothetical protein
MEGACADLQIIWLLNDTSLINPETVQRKQQILMGHTGSPSFTVEGFTVTKVPWVVNRTATPSVAHSLTVFPFLVKVSTVSHRLS